MYTYIYIYKKKYKYKIHTDIAHIFSFQKRVKGFVRGFFICKKVAYIKIKTLFFGYYKFVYKQ